MNRKLHVWRVRLVNTANGQETDAEFACYWDPDQEGTAQAVMTACAAVHTVATQRRTVYAGLRAELVDDRDVTVGVPAATATADA